jgi:hypothetical protein
MLTILRWKGYRFFWYVSDGTEPPHVHVAKDGRECKIWLRELSVAFNQGLSSPRLPPKPQNDRAGTGRSLLSQ